MVPSGTREPVEHSCSNWGGTLCTFSTSVGCMLHLCHEGGAGAYCVYVEDEAQRSGLLLPQVVVQQHCSRALVHFVLRTKTFGQRKVRQDSLAIL